MRVSPKLHSLLLLLALSLTTAQAAAFSDKTQLQAALAEWCISPTGATATHGDISTWDTSAVSDMSMLVYNLDTQCRDDFNANVNNWNVASVTNMAFMFRVPASQVASCCTASALTTSPSCPRRMP